MQSLKYSTLYFICLYCLVVTHCCGIHNTTKGLHSVRKREMPTTCEVFCLLHGFPKSFRSVCIFEMKQFGEKKCKECYLLTRNCIFSLQEKKIMHNLRQYQVPLQRYMAMMDLQVLEKLLADDAIVLS